ncbi:MAG: SDR family oxidoreductase [Chitinivibrionales bacterium]|nr:SDR family oxidoreductase [Chitinivibrionales bacterium]
MMETKEKSPVENKDILYCASLATIPDPSCKNVLVTGASGYIGGRLVPELLARGYRVRIMARQALRNREDVASGAEVVVADALNRASLDEALEGMDVAYYLIHSMLLGPCKFEKVDRTAAINFREAAQKARLKRIVYLGGLGDSKSNLSTHLKSRLQVSQELQMGQVPVTILRAAIIIGSGSASYEIINNLVKNLPVLPVPAWARTLCQPIAVRDVIKYLVGAIEAPQTAGQSYDIGGESVLSYEEMLRMHADILGKKTLFIPVPFSSIRLFSYLASLFTPVPHQIIRCLMESIVNEVVCKDNCIHAVLPFPLLPLREALVRALTREEQDRVSTRWSDAYPPAHELAITLEEVLPRPQFTVVYSLTSTKDRAALFTSICEIGGKEGWFNSNWMWKLRGQIDRLLLGVGTARGRRSQHSLRVNDVIDFWRVENIEADRTLLLRAEMKLPGKAWLMFTIEPVDGKNKLSVTALYQANTIAAKLYWYFFLPFHHFIFRDLITEIEKRS